MNQPAAEDLIESMPRPQSALRRRAAAGLRHPAGISAVLVFGLIVGAVGGFVAGHSNPQSLAGLGLAGPHYAVTADSLLTWENLQAAGESGPGTVPYDATLVFPALCWAENAWAQYSEPYEVVSKAWVISDGVLTQSDLQYRSEQQAIAALDRLAMFAQACPEVNEYTTLRSVGVGQNLTANLSIYYFEMRLESGKDGSISTVEIAVAHIANVLIEVVFRPDGPTVADADDRSQAVASAALNRVVATG